MRWIRSAWAALGLALGCSAEALEGPVTIELHSRTLVLDQRLDDDLRDALEAGAHDHVLAYLLFDRDVAPSDHRALDDAGIDLLESLGQDAYSAAVPAGAATPWSVLDALVRAGTLVRPEDKWSPAFALPRVRRDDEEEDAPDRVRVDFRRGVSEQQVARALESFGLVGEPVGNGRSFRVTADEEAVERLSGDPRVLWIEPVQPDTRFLGELARAWTNVDRVHLIDYDPGNPPATFHGRSGAGVRVAVCDDGADETHPEFQEIGTSTSRFDVPSPATTDHGTAVAAMIGARGAPNAAEGYPGYAFRGHAPAVKLMDSPPVSGDLSLWHPIVDTHQCDVSNHSYSISAYTTYQVSHVLDLERVIRGDASWNGVTIPSRPAVFAAGNLGDGDEQGFLPHAGYYSIEAVAKNPIAVGSIDTIDGRISRTSSLGPTIDGRIKPDVVAPGAYDSIPDPPTGVIAAVTGKGHGFHYGTSISAPVVAGVLALVAEERNEKGVQADAMSAATHKAILVTAARDAVSEVVPEPARRFDNADTGQPVLYHAGPDWATGFGVVDAPRTVATVAEGRWLENVLSYDGQEHVHCIFVPRGAGELRVALAWDDVPGALALPKTAPRLVNDLDLELVDPCGEVFLPWTLERPPQAQNADQDGADPITDLAAHLPPARRGPLPDRVNNVELVSLPEPEPGFWRVRVTAFDLEDPDGGAQRYGLAASHAFGSCLALDPDPGDVAINLCKQFPPLCAADAFDFAEFGPAGPLGRHWTFEPASVLPLDELCKFAVDCPGCPGSVWAECPPFTLRASNLTGDTILHVFSDGEDVVSSAASTRGVASVTVAPRRDRRYFVHFTGANHRPLSEPLAVRIEFDPAGED